MDIPILNIYQQVVSHSDPSSYRQDDDFSGEIPIGVVDGAQVSVSFREDLKRIRAEHPRLMRAFETGSFD